MAGTIRGFIAPGVIHGIAQCGIGGGAGAVYMPDTTTRGSMVAVGTARITIIITILTIMAITETDILPHPVTLGAHMPEEEVQLRTTAAIECRQAVAIHLPVVPRL
jgi:hypothetical protein